MSTVGKHSDEDMFARYVKKQESYEKYNKLYKQKRKEHLDQLTF